MFCIFLSFLLFLSFFEISLTKRHASHQKNKAEFVYWLLKAELQEEHDSQNLQNRHHHHSQIENVKIIGDNEFATLHNRQKHHKKSHKRRSLYNFNLGEQFDSPQINNGRNFHGFRANNALVHDNNKVHQKYKHLALAKPYWPWP